MKIKTSELTGPALDWAVAKSEGERYGPPTFHVHQNSKGATVYLNTGMQQSGIPYRPSTGWAQAGPIIEREMIDLRKIYNNGLPNANPYDCWKAEIIFRDGKLVAGDLFAYGPTPLVAALRCFVASRLGDEVEVPDELLCTP